MIRRFDIRGTNLYKGGKKMEGKRDERDGGVNRIDVSKWKRWVIDKKCE
jgi:hypothetical protein